MLFYVSLNLSLSTEMFLDDTSGILNMYRGYPSLCKYSKVFQNPSAPSFNRIYVTDRGITWTVAECIRIAFLYTFSVSNCKARGASLDMSYIRIGHDFLTSLETKCRAWIGIIGSKCVIRVFQVKFIDVSGI